jgi:hypothetical protein
MLKTKLFSIISLFLFATINAMENPGDDNNNNNWKSLPLVIYKNENNDQNNIPTMTTTLGQASRFGQHFNRQRSSSATTQDTSNRRNSIKQIFKQKGIYIAEDTLAYLVHSTKKDTLPTMEGFVTFMAEELFATGEIHATKEFCIYACEKKFQTEVVINSVKNELTATKNQIQGTNNRLTSLEEKVEESRKISLETAKEQKELRKAIDQLIKIVTPPPMTPTQPAPDNVPGNDISNPNTEIKKSAISPFLSKLFVAGTLGLAGYGAFKMSELQQNNNELGDKIYKVAMENEELKKKLLELATAATPKAAEVVASSIWSSYCTIL